MSKELMQNILMNLGLTETEAHIYLYLMKEGGQKAREIGQALNLYKQQLYRSLRKMQSKGFLNASGYSAHFSAVSFEELVDLLIKTNIEKAEYVMKNREQLLSGWQSIIRKEFSDS